MNIRSVLRLLPVLCLVVPCAIGGVSSEAAACEESISFEIDPKVMLLSQAETSLNAGKARAAAVNVLNAFPKLRTSEGSDAMQARGQRILALAVVRTEGLLSVGEVMKASTAEERRANLEWAVATLRKLNEAKKNVPALETELGEALSKLPETQGEALAVLDRLAGKDLITSPQGWAALAKLRRDAGDQEGGEAAARRHEAMTKPGKGAPAAAPARPASAPAVQPGLKRFPVEILRT